MLHRARFWGVVLLLLISYILKISAGKSNISTQPIQQAVAQISCCAFNVDGSIFVTGSCDKFARVICLYVMQYLPRWLPFRDRQLIANMVNSIMFVIVVDYSHQPHWSYYN